MGHFSNSFPKHFSYLCEYAFGFDQSCSFCEYPFISHCLHCSPSCFDPDSLLLAHLWLGLSWIYCISANKSFSSPKTSSWKPYTSSKQQERQKHSVETTINLSVPVCRKWRALLSGCRWRVAARLNPSAADATGSPPWGLRQGKSWLAGQAWRSPAISSAVPVGASSGATCHMTASIAHVEKGHARGGVYTSPMISAAVFPQNSKSCIFRTAISNCTQ